MEKLKNILLWTSLLMLSQSTFSQNNFLIKLQAEGFDDSTTFILFNRYSEKLISTEIHSEKAEFEGRIEQQQPMFLYSKGERPLFFWLDSCDVNISLKAGEISKGQVIGSIYHDQYSDHESRVSLLRKKLDAEYIELYANIESDFGIDSANVFKLKWQDDKEKALYKVTEDFICENPKTFIAQHFYSDYMYFLTKESCSRIWPKMPVEFHKSPEGQVIQAYIKNEFTYKKGDPFYSFSLADSSGRMHKINDSLKKFTILDFWSSTCPGCIRDHKLLKTKFSELQKQGVGIIGINLDSSESSWKGGMKRDSIPWLSLGAPEEVLNPIYAKYELFGTPKYFLLDKAGRIVEYELYLIDLLSLLKELLEAEK